MEKKLSREQVLEIAMKIYPINKSENSLTSVKLNNRRMLKVDAFVKGYLTCQNTNSNSFGRA